MLWVKAEVIKGNFVTLGAIGPDGSGPYSHIASVIGVDSNKPASSTAPYDGTDLLILEDHGTLTEDGYVPAVPPGAGTTSGCTPYRWGLLPLPLPLLLLPVPALLLLLLGRAAAAGSAGWCGVWCCQELQSK